MKIEIGESLLYSWLRHVEKCQVVQMNWQPSPEWLKNSDGLAEQFYDQCRHFFHDQHSLPIFGQNSFSQLIKQAEVDVIGVATTDGETKLTLVDVAYHSGGLNYGPTDKTVNAVLKKFLRSVIVVQVYFNVDSTEVVFATPKINPRQREAIDTSMKLIDELFETTGQSAQCRLIANEEFFLDIVSPLQRLSVDVADTSELFMRSIQMLSLRPATTSAEPEIISPISNQGKTEKIGVLVKREFRGLLDNDKLNDSTLGDLLDPDKSKSIFGLAYPVLKESTDPNDRFDENGHGRYYRDIYGGRYLLCSQWFERNRNRLEAWLQSIDTN